MEPEYREQYGELYRKHWWWRARTEYVVEALARLRPPQGWNTILDVGCGEALFFDRLLQLGDVEGVELEEGLTSVPEEWRDRIHIGPFDHTFQPAKQYSLILMLDVLEHLSDPTASLVHARRLLAPEGILLVTVPAFQALWTNHDVINHHLVRYTKESLRRLAERANLQVLEEGYFFQWTFPAKLVVRGIERLLHLAPKMPTIPPKWINEGLYSFSRIEQKSLSRLPMPFGSSLMVVARP